MHLRRAEPPDLASVIGCSEQAFAAFAGASSQGDAPSGDVEPKTDRELTSQILDGAVSLICDERKILGYIALQPTTDHLFVDSVAVLPKHHGKGLGSQLMAFAEMEALRLNLSSVRLFTNAKMVANHRFYLRRGYLETGRCDNDGYARVFYSKDI